MRLFGLASLVTVTLALGACEGTLIAEADCGLIEEGGCPDKGDAVDQCFDYRCRALYRCVQDPNDPATGTWEFRRDCPYQEPPEAGAPTDARDGASSDAAPPRDGGLPSDLPPGAFGGPGCVSLQLPDCSLATGYGCSTRCCECEDLYVCEEGAWYLWGHCQDDQPTKL